MTTPALLLDRDKLDRNIARMNARMQVLGVDFRPHLKTVKSHKIAQLATAGWSGAITVSTLKEAEYFFEAGFSNILYAVGIAPGKLAQAEALARRGARLTLILDCVEAAQAVAAHGASSSVIFPILIEIDADKHRAGVDPGSDQLIHIGRVLHEAIGAELCGVLAHAGGSYACRGAEALAAHAELERSQTVRAAECLREAGLPSPIVSIGSTPTALFARDLTGVTEIRAGVYMTMDLVMAELGVCNVDDIALTVETAVIGHQHDRGRLIVDAGWMALSRDRGLPPPARDCGYGMVQDAAEPLFVQEVNQEHGLIGRMDGEAIDPARYPIGSTLRILPNHACATAAQYAEYRVSDGTRWSRFSGW